MTISVITTENNTLSKRSSISRLISLPPHLLVEFFLPTVSNRVPQQSVYVKEPNLIVLKQSPKIDLLKRADCLQTHEATYLGLPDQSVGVGVIQLLHDSLDGGAHLLRIGVPSVDHLQQRHKGVQSPTLCGARRPHHAW